MYHLHQDERDYELRLVPVYHYRHLLQYLRYQTGLGISRLMLHKRINFIILATS